MEGVRGELGATVHRTRTCAQSDQALCIKRCVAMSGLSSIAVALAPQSCLQGQATAGKGIARSLSNLARGGRLCRGSADDRAICERCGTAFPSGFVVENSRSIEFRGNRSGPCPKCGGMGNVLDGIFDFVGNTIRVISAPERTLAELAALEALLQEARQRNMSGPEVAERMVSELPGLRAVADEYRRAPIKTTGALVAIILAAVHFVRRLEHAPQSTPEIVAQQVINNYVESLPPRQQRAQSKQKIGRNEPCPCGSGKRYKDCHGCLAPP